MRHDIHTYWNPESVYERSTFKKDLAFAIAWVIGYCMVMWVIHD